VPGASRLERDELHLEVVGVGEVGGVVLGSAGVRMPFGEQQRPAAEFAAQFGVLLLEFLPVVQRHHRS